MLQELIGDGRVAMIGPIRQELLSGVKTSAQFKKLAEALEAFPDEELGTEDYVEAALASTAVEARAFRDPIQISCSAP